MSILSTEPQRPLAFVATGLLLGAALAVVFSAPATASLSATGIWIFPHERQEKVLAGTLGSLFYNTTSGDEWIADAFFADADADGATVTVDFYNPTSGDLSNVIVWVAISNDTLFTSVDFSGGSSGDVSVVAADLGGGTPTTGAALPDFVYPAFFTSYGVGDVAAGSSGIQTITLDVTGDFDGGLVVRLDYTAEDAGGGDLSGPFDAGMSVYEWGDLPAQECPDETGLHLGGSLSQGKYESGQVDFTASLSLVPAFEYEASDVTMTLRPAPGLTLVDLPGGDIAGGAGTLALEGTLSGNYTQSNISLKGSLLLLDGDMVSLSLSASWDGCDGGGEDAAVAALEVELQPSGRAKTATYWAGDLRQALRDEDRGSERADHNTSAYTVMTQVIALHSAFFTYGPWEGEDPLGGEDEGWVDISDLEDDRDILRKSGGGNGRVKEAQQELLALWLNIASGRVNLDSALEASRENLARGGDDDDDDEEDDDDTDGFSLPDNVGAIVDAAEAALTDYFEAGSDGSQGHRWWRSHSALARALWEAATLCWLVNAGWLQVA